MLWMWAHSSRGIGGHQLWWSAAPHKAGIFFRLCIDDGNSTSMDIWTDHRNQLRHTFAFNQRSQDNTHAMNKFQFHTCTHVALWFGLAGVCKHINIPFIMIDGDPTFWWLISMNYFGVDIFEYVRYCISIHRMMRASNANNYVWWLNSLAVTRKQKFRLHSELDSRIWKDGEC